MNTNRKIMPNKCENCGCKDDDYFYNDNGEYLCKDCISDYLMGALNE